MAQENWVNTYCLNEEGFPKLLYAALDSWNQARPEYEGREFEEYGTERCHMTIRIGTGDQFPDKQSFVVTTIGFRFADTYQAVAHKALRMLCQIYEREVAHSPIRFFPPYIRRRPVWLARMRTLEGRELREDDPTVVFMAAYLLTLDDFMDKQSARLRRQILRAEEAETMVRRLQVQLAEAQAQIAIAESREAAAKEALKEAEDRHGQQLKDAYLVTRPKRRMLRLEEQEIPILEGIPITSHAKEKGGPSVPPPTEDSRRSSEVGSMEEEVLPLSQPPPRDDLYPLLIAVEEPHLSE